MSKTRQRTRAKARLQRAVAEGSGQRTCAHCQRPLPYRSHHQRCSYCRVWFAGRAMQRDLREASYLRGVEEQQRRKARTA